MKRIKITDKNEYFASMSAVVPKDRESIAVDDSVLSLARGYNCREFCEDASGIYLFQKESGKEILPTESSKRLFEFLRGIVDIPVGFVSGFRLSNRCGRNYLDICVFDMDSEEGVGSILACGKDWEVQRLGNPPIYYEEPYDKYNQANEEVLCFPNNLLRMTELVRAVVKDIESCGIPVGMYTYCGVSKDSKVECDFLDPEDKVRFGVANISVENGFKYRINDCIALLAIFNIY